MNETTSKVLDFIPSMSAELSDITKSTEVGSMSNIDKATDLIDKGINTTVVDPRAPWYEQCPPRIAQALADAGLIAPELPEPDRSTGMWYPTAYGYGIGNVVTRDGGVKLNINTSRVLEPHEARELAHMVLAAANQAEKEQGEA